MKGNPTFAAVIANTLASLLFLSTVQAETLFGLVGTSAGSALTTFDSATPGVQHLIGSLSGVVAGQSVRAIDIRPGTGTLYALSHDGANVGWLYQVDIHTATLTPIGSGFLLAYAGTRVSMDFNPVVDRIRVVDLAGDNLRLNPVTGAVVGVDTALAYGPSDVQTGVPAIAGVAYANNVIGATSTTLFAWDWRSDALVTIGGPDAMPSPNGGVVATIFIPPTPVTTGTNIGFDISGASGIAYVSHDLGSTSTEDQLDRIDLATGARVVLGTFGSTRILDIAANSDRIFADGVE